MKVGKLIQIEGPACEPINVGDVKPSARIDGSEFDSQLAIIIPALRSQAESRIGRFLINQVIELALDEFTGREIDLHLPGVSSIVSVKYFDESGNAQIVPTTAYQLDDVSYISRLILNDGTCWPAIKRMPNGVRIRFIAGYGDAPGDVPQDIRLWMIAHAVQMVNAPDGLSDATIKPLPFLDSLLDKYRVWRAQ